MSKREVGIDLKDGAPGSHQRPRELTRAEEANGGVPLVGWRTERNEAMIGAMNAGAAQMERATSDDERAAIKADTAVELEYVVENTK